MCDCSSLPSQCGLADAIGRQQIFADVDAAKLLRSDGWTRAVEFAVLHVIVRENFLGIFSFTSNKYAGRHG